MSSSSIEVLSPLPDELRRKVQGIIEKHPDTLETLVELCSYFTDKSNDINSSSNNDTSNKKRKINDSNIDSNNIAQPDTLETSNFDESSVLKIQGVSIQAPFRKKLDIVLAKEVVILRKAQTPEYTVKISEIDAVFFLPIPEKAKPHWALIIIPKKNTEKGTNLEVVMATIAEDTIKSVIKPETGGELYSGSIQEILLLFFQRRGIAITSNETMPPGQSLINVNAYRGSKDGQLYFLPDSVFFGFKKPLLIFLLSKILSISYSSITKSTFNLIIKYTENPLEGEASSTSLSEYEFEFSMLDQNNFETINRYVEYHGLNNESLAEKRRAKVDAKAIFPDELIKASRASGEGDVEDNLHSKSNSNPISGPSQTSISGSGKNKSGQTKGTTTENGTLNGQEFDSEDDEEDEDFQDGKDEEEGDDDDDDEEESGNDNDDDDEDDDENESE